MLGTPQKDWREVQVLYRRDAARLFPGSSFCLPEAPGCWPTHGRVDAHDDPADGFR